MMVGTKTYAWGCGTMKRKFSSSRFASTVVHSSAINGFNAASAESYERGRPTYSASSLKHIVSVMNSVSLVSPNARNRTIVELGSGTGKFTTSLVSFLQEKPFTLPASFANVKYIATEPSEGFRKILAGKSLHNVDVQFGTGDSIPAESNSVDIIVAAQAFHWMANAATIRETHRILRPGGAIVLIWNTYDYKFDWVRQLDDQILTPAYNYKGNVPRQQTGLWRKCFTEKAATDNFGNLHAWYESYTHVGTRETIVNRILSTSVIAEREDSYQQDVLKTLNSILDCHTELEDSRKSGIFPMPYITEIVWAFAKK